MRHTIINRMHDTHSTCSVQCIGHSRPAVRVSSATEQLGDQGGRLRSAAPRGACHVAELFSVSKQQQACRARAHGQCEHAKRCPCLRPRISYIKAGSTESIALRKSCMIAADLTLSWHQPPPRISLHLHLCQKRLPVQHFCTSARLQWLIQLHAHRESMARDVQSRFQLSASFYASN